MNVDFLRLQRFFNLAPRGAFELSHLHNLVTYGAGATTRLRKLSLQVEEHLGLPLCKGSVRTSNWSRPLDEKQITYAAADVYAGYMLFHCLNAKRAAMRPMPPLPVHAELYKGLGRDGLHELDPVNTLRLASTDGHVSCWAFFRKDVPAVDQLHVDEDELRDEVTSDLPTALAQEPEVSSGGAVHAKEDTAHLVETSRSGMQTQPGQGEPLSSSKAQTKVLAQRDSDTSIASIADVDSAGAEDTSIASIPDLDSAGAETLFQILVAHRETARAGTNLPFYKLGVPDKTLREMSQTCPRNRDELLQIPGIGEFKANANGDAWLAIIEAFLQEHAAHRCQTQDSPIPIEDFLEEPAAYRCQTQDSPGSAEVAPLPNLPATTPAVLHAGLSFEVDSMSLMQEEITTGVVGAGENESFDASSAFGGPFRSPSPASPRRKRQALGKSSEGQPRARRMSTLSLHEARVSASIGMVLAAPTATGKTWPKAQSTAAPLPNDMGRVQGIKNESTRRTIPKQKSPSPKTPSIAQPRSQHEISATRDTEQQDRIFRNKLIALNKFIAPGVVLPEATVELIVKNPPRTTEELIQIPGVLPFANACAKKQTSLLRFIRKADSKRTPVS